MLELANWRQFNETEEGWRCGWDLCKRWVPLGEPLSPLGLKNLGVAQSLKPRENNSMQKGAWQEFCKLLTKISTPKFSPMLPSPAACASHWENPTRSQGQAKPGRWSSVAHVPGPSTERRGRRVNWRGTQNTSSTDTTTRSAKMARFYVLGSRIKQMKMYPWHTQMTTEFNGNCV